MRSPDTRKDYHPCACGCGDRCRGIYKVGHAPIKGYRFGQGKRSHVLKAELALGKPLPPGAEVHHINGDKDNPNAKLVICQDSAYHALLHLRTKLLRAGGNPNTDAWCSRCKQPKPRSNFYIRKSSSGRKPAGTITTRCKQCSKEASNEWRWKTGRRQKGRRGRPPNSQVGMSSLPMLD